jgi:hypothetical protein
VAGLGVLVGMIAVLSSCEELLFESPPDNSPQSIFDQTWTFVDREYSFFDYKDVFDTKSWDDIYDDYEPRISSDMSDQELFDVLADMLYVLEDGHVNLRSDFDRSRNWQWFLQDPPNYDYSVLQRYYFTDGGFDTVGRSIEQYVGDAFILMDFKDNAGNVGYIHYRSFSNAIREKDMDYVIERFSGNDYKGLIIDVRDNGGGSLGNVTTIGDRLVTEKTRVAEERVKTGPAHDDFSDLQPLFFEPPEDRPIYEKHVVVLTNQMSYSATNIFAATTKALDDVTLMGQATGGGGGAPAFTELSNGWELRVSASQYFAMEEANSASDPPYNIENGVEPDEARESTEAELATGTDSILEEALAYLRNE